MNTKLIRLDIYDTKRDLLRYNCTVFSIVNELMLRSIRDSVSVGIVLVFWVDKGIDRNRNPSWARGRLVIRNHQAIDRRERRHKRGTMTLENE